VRSNYRAQAIRTEQADAVGVQRAEVLRGRGLGRIGVELGQRQGTRQARLLLRAFHLDAHAAAREAGLQADAEVALVEVAVVAVVLAALARHGDVGGDVARHLRQRRAHVVLAELAGFGEHRAVHAGLRAAAGHDLDHAAGGALAVQHAAAAAHDLDALDGIDRDRRQHGIGQLVFVEAHAVDHDHHVLRTVGTEAAQVEREVGRAVQALAPVHAADLADGGVDVVDAGAADLVLGDDGGADRLQRGVAREAGAGDDDGGRQVLGGGIGAGEQGQGKGAGQRERPHGRCAAGKDSRMHGIVFFGSLTGARPRTPVVHGSGAWRRLPPVLAGIRARKTDCATFLRDAQWSSTQPAAFMGGACLPLRGQHTLALRRGRKRAVFPV
jgi:hypothetical protein